MTEILPSLALILLFVLIGGYFSAAELALVSLREGQLSRFAERGGRAARVAKLRENPNRFLSAVQIGITFAGFFSVAYGGSTLTGPLTVALTGLGLPQGPADVAALVTVTGAISYLSLVLSELVPQRLALQRSETVALFAAPVLDRIATLCHPNVHVRDLLTALHVRHGDEDAGRPGADGIASVATGRQPRTVRDIVRPVTFLPGSKALLPALSQLRHTGGHLAGRRRRVRRHRRHRHP